MKKKIVLLGALLNKLTSCGGYIQKFVLSESEPLNDDVEVYFFTHIL